jgi:hypothetical protein
MTARLSLMPIPGMNWISLNGFYRTQDKDTTAKDSSLENSLTYMGGGFSIKHNIVKCGANYVTVAQKVNDEDKQNAEEKKEKLYLVDAWISLNGQGFFRHAGTGLRPLLVRRRQRPVSRFKSHRYFSRSGIQYSSNFRIMGYYSQTDLPEGENGKKTTTAAIQ